MTLEDSLSAKSLRAPFEISLLMLEIDGYDESNLFPHFEFALDPDVAPIIHEFTHDDDGESFSKYYDPKLAPGAPELTTEVEALLINSFKPKYNDVLYENYPLILSGTRSAGYTQSRLVIERMPAMLRTEHHVQQLVLPPHE